jgi:hypothetical protein
MILLPVVVAAQTDQGSAGSDAPGEPTGDSAAESAVAAAESDDPAPIDVMVFRPWNLAAGESAEAGGEGTGDPRAAEYESIIYDIVINEVRAAGYRAFETEPWEAYRAEYRRDDVFQRLPVDIAAEADMDISLSVYFRLEETRVFLMVKAHDIRSDKIIAGGTQLARSGLVLLNSMNRLMDQILDQIAEAEEDIRFMKANPGMRVGTAAATVLFLSENEGAILSMPGIGEFGTVTDGQAELPYQPLALGQQLEVVKSLPGYYSESQAFTLTDSYNEVQLSELYPETRFASEFAWNAWFALGLNTALRYYLIPDQTFLRLSNQFYFDPPPKDALPGARTIIHDEITLEAGTYLFFPAQSRYRILAASGIGLAFTPLTPETLAVDSFLNVVAVHHELNFQHFVLYIRQELRYVLEIFPTRILSTGIGMTPELVPTTLGVMIKW